jgi:hypothetical protein
MAGVKQVLTGDTLGWTDLRSSARYLFWDCRIVASLYGQGFYKQFVIGLDSVANCLAHSIACFEDEASGWLGCKLAQSFQGQAFGYWEKTPFEPFMARLYQIWVGQVKPGAPSPTNLGVYQRVLDAWDAGDAQLHDALAVICNYHVQRTEDRDDSDFAEFTRPPYLIFPAEILAIIRVRKDLGLSTPTIDHPLMQTPLANPPVEMPAVNDELLDRVIAKVRTILPLV